MVTFLIFGRALLEAIDKSLQNQKQQRQQQQTPSTAGEGQGAKGGGGDQTLLEAKRKVKTVMAVEAALIAFCVLTSFPVLITEIDLVIPLSTFGVTFGYMPLMWLAFNIRVHGGRSGPHARLVSPLSSGLRSPWSRSRLRPSRSKCSSKQEQQVVPTEVPC